MAVAPILQITNLLAGWHGRPVAAIDNLSVEQGQVTVMCGPNGVGKSTIARTIARQIKKLSGNVVINGKDMDVLDASAFAKQLAYVPQMLETTYKLSVEEFVSIGRNPHQIWCSWSQSQQDCSAVEDALRQTQLTELRHKLLTELSGGERQRSAIALALAQKTPLMVLDEPTAHLDYKHQLELLQLFGKLKSEGLSFLIVLHDLNLAAQVADSVVLLAKANGAGKVVATGAPSEVLTAERLSQIYDVSIEVVQNPESGLRAFLVKI